MAFSEKPPMLTGDARQDIAAVRDYLFRLAESLTLAATEANAKDVRISYDKNGRQVLAKTDETTEAVQKSAQELRALIIKTANDVTEYADSKVEEYNRLYVAQSDFGTFQESIFTTIENTARGVVESYNYGSAITSALDGIALMQSYFRDINGEIRRGIVEDPDTGEYVTGIAISQTLSFNGECDSSDVNNPGDGYTYYYLNSGQTFGLYTSTGWQFWIDGYKKGWFNSEDGMLHVANVVVESTMWIGDSWQITTNLAGEEFEITHVGD